MNRILHVQAKPVFGWGASLVVSLALAGAAALTGWWLAGPPAATGLPPASGPVPDLTQAQVWPAAAAKDAPAATWRQQPRPPDRGSQREPPDTRARNGAIPLARLTASHPLAAEAFLQEVLLVAQPRGGFSVQAVEPDGVYDKMGLRSGDVIYSLDTPEMNDIDENSMISLMQQTQIGLNIYRNGTLVALRHALNAEEEPAPAEQR